MLHKYDLASAASGRSTYRRSYKKSTTGCHSCKSRKIKCDESRPVCLNCRRHYISASSCRYGCEPRLPHDANVGPEPARLLIRPTTVGSTNTLALRLMHHYTISIGITQLPGSPQMNLLTRSLWEVKIPSVAFDSELVLKALLGISAWHLWAVNPNDDKMKIVSRNFFGEAIRLQRAALKQQDTEQLIPTFIAGMVIAHHCWLLSHSDGYSPQLQLGTFYLCNGYRTLGKSLPPPWSEYAYLGELNPHRVQFESKEDGEIMQEGVQDSNSLLEAVQNMEFDLKVKAVYCKVIAELLSMYGLVASDNNDVSTKEYVIVSFLHRVPWPFINLLQRQEPFAMGLLARAWALLAPIHKISKAWYIHGAGQFQVYTRAIVSIGNLMPDEWAWIMDWPLKMTSNYGT